MTTILNLISQDRSLFCKHNSIDEPVIGITNSPVRKASHSDV